MTETVAYIIKDQTVDKDTFDIPNKRKNAKPGTTRTVRLCVKCGRLNHSASRCTDSGSKKGKGKQDLAAEGTLPDPDGSRKVDIFNKDTLQKCNSLCVVHQFSAVDASVSKSVSRANVSTLTVSARKPT